MDFDNQFGSLDPKEGRVPGHPFSLLPSIASRARRILHSRSREEITAAARMIDDVLDQYFENARDAFIEQQLGSNGWVCKYIDEHAPDRQSGLRELILTGLPDTANDAEYFDFPNRENTTKIEALRRCRELGYTFNSEEFKDAQLQEVFAVLALWHLGDCLKWLKWNPWQDDGSGDPGQASPGLWMALPDTELKSLGLSLAGREALEAMEAVCYAECVGGLVLRNCLIENLATKLHQHDQRVDEQAERKLAERLSQNGRKAAAKRHEENVALRECAIQYYEAHEASFRSIESAAAAIAGKIVPVTHRTVVDWLRAHKKQRSASRP